MELEPAKPQLPAASPVTLSGNESPAHVDGTTQAQGLVPWPPSRWVATGNWLAALAGVLFFLACIFPLVLYLALMAAREYLNFLSGGSFFPRRGMSPFVELSEFLTGNITNEQWLWFLVRLGLGALAIWFLAWMGWSYVARILADRKLPRAQPAQRGRSDSLASVFALITLCAVLFVYIRTVADLFMNDDSKERLGPAYDSTLQAFAMAVTFSTLACGVLGALSRMRLAGWIGGTCLGYVTSGVIAVSLFRAERQNLACLRACLIGGTIIVGWAIYEHHSRQRRAWSELLTSAADDMPLN